MDLQSRIFTDFKLPDNADEQEQELDKWKDKLLDFSFRNRLLNFKPNRGTIEILCHNPGEMEDVLAGQNCLAQVLQLPIGPSPFARAGGAINVLFSQI